jgi:hypothetical protein
VVILNPNVYNILIARHVTVTFFLFVGSAWVLAHLRRETCAIDAGRLKQQQKPKKRPTGGCCTVARKCGCTQQLGGRVQLMWRRDDWIGIQTLGKWNATGGSFLVWFPCCKSNKLANALVFIQRCSATWKLTKGINEYSVLITFEIMLIHAHHTTRWRHSIMHSLLHANSN